MKSFYDPAGRKYSETLPMKVIGLLHIQVYRLSSPLTSLKSVSKYLQFWWLLFFSSSTRIFTAG